MMRTFCQAMSGRAGSDRIHSLAHPMLESTASRSRPPSSFWLSARDRATTPSEAVASIRSRTNVFIHGAAATPTPLIEAMAARRDLLDVRLYHLHTAGPAPFAEPGREREFLSNSLFVGAPLRPAVASGHADYVPIFLSDIPGLFTNGIVKLDVALLQLSPPDEHGLCSLGTSADAALAAADTAELVIAEINEQMPRTHGNNVVPFDRISAFIATDRPLLEHHPERETEVEAQNGELVAALVEDGSTLQMGIGGLPDATLARLGGKHDLGVH